MTAGASARAGVGWTVVGAGAAGVGLTLEWPSMRTGTQHTEPDRTAETPISSPFVWSRIAGGTAKYCPSALAW